MSAPKDPRDGGEPTAPAAERRNPAGEGAQQDGHARMAEILNDNLGELATAMGIRVVSASREQLVARMPVAGNRQPFGLLHGGASAVLAETLGSIHSAVLAPEGRSPVGIELSCTHHRSAREGFVTATCRPVSVGRTVATMSITVEDEGGRPCCTARLTCLYRSAP